MTQSNEAVSKTAYNTKESSVYDAEIATIVYNYKNMLTYAPSENLNNNDKAS